MAIARFLGHMCLALRASGLWLRYATLQNLIPSFPWIVPPRPPPWRNPRKGRDQILPSGNLGIRFRFGLVLHNNVGGGGGNGGGGPGSLLTGVGGGAAHQNFMGTDTSDESERDDDDDHLNMQDLANLG